jgi:hypothetical protein
MSTFTTTLLIVLSIIFLAPQLQGRQAKISRAGVVSAFPPVQCSQPASIRGQLMREAEKKRYTVRRVEFIGHTYTRDETLRRRMSNLQEGELFSRRKLFNSLRSVSKLRGEIYPVRVSDVVIQLNRPDQLVDMIICFKPKRF